MIDERPRGYAPETNNPPEEHTHESVREKAWQVLVRAQEQLADIGGLDACPMTVRIPKDLWTQFVRGYVRDGRHGMYGPIVVEEDPTNPHETMPEGA